MVLFGVSDLEGVCAVSTGQDHGAGDGSVGTVPTVGSRVVVPCSAVVTFMSGSCLGYGGVVLSLGSGNLVSVSDVSVV